MRVDVRRGDVYRCRRRGGGWVRVKVTHVNAHGPWVTVHRVGPGGRRIRSGWTHAEPEQDTFTVYLTNRGDGTDVMRMPLGYEAT